MGGGALGEGEGKRETGKESQQEFKLTLSFGMKLSCALVEVELAQIFLESHRDFSGPGSMIINER